MTRYTIITLLAGIFLGAAAVTSALEFVYPLGSEVFPDVPEGAYVVLNHIHASYRAAATLPHSLGDRHRLSGPVALPSSLRYVVPSCFAGSAQTVPPAVRW